jgi:hypothetical protein
MRLSARDVIVRASCFFSGLYVGGLAVSLMHRHQTDEISELRTQIVELKSNIDSYKKIEALRNTGRNENNRK